MTVGERGPRGDHGQPGEIGPAGADGRVSVWLIYAIAAICVVLILVTWIQVGRVNDFATDNCERGNASRTEINTLSGVVAAGLRSDVQVREEFKNGSTASQRRALRGAIQRDTRHLRQIDTLPLTNCADQP